MAPWKEERDVTPGNSQQERIDATTADLLVAVKERGFVISADKRVGEQAAATLLGITPNHLKALRHQGTGPFSYQRGVGGSRISYRLDDLAAWIESAREGWAKTGV